jgi:hypothetical protein
VIGFTGIYIDYNEEQNSRGFHASQGWPQRKNNIQGPPRYLGEAAAKVGASSFFKVASSNIYVEYKIFGQAASKTTRDTKLFREWPQNILRTQSSACATRV